MGADRFATDNAGVSVAGAAGATHKSKEIGDDIIQLLTHTEGVECGLEVSIGGGNSSTEVSIINGDFNLSISTVIEDDKGGLRDDIAQVEADVGDDCESSDQILLPINEDMRVLTSSEAITVKADSHLLGTENTIIEDRNENTIIDHSKVQITSLISPDADHPGAGTFNVQYLYLFGWTTFL